MVWLVELTVEFTELSTFIVSAVPNTTTCCSAAAPGRDGGSVIRKAHRLCAGA